MVAIVAQEALRCGDFAELSSLLARSSADRPRSRLVVPYGACVVPDRRRVVSAAAALAAGAVLIVASFERWAAITLHVPGGAFAIGGITGWRYTGWISQASIGDEPGPDATHPNGIGGGVGDLTIFAGVVLIVLAVLALVAFRSGRGAGDRRWSVATLVTGCLATLVPVLVLVDIAVGNSRHRSTAGLSESPAVFLWVTLAAAVVAGLAGGWELLARRRSVVAVDG